MLVNSLLSRLWTRNNNSFWQQDSRGMDAQEGEWPWQASLQQNGVHRWGATLISNSGLFTPAHRFIK